MAYTLCWYLFGTMAVMVAGVFGTVKTAVAFIERIRCVRQPSMHFLV